MSNERISQKSESNKVKLTLDDLDRASGRHFVAWNCPFEVCKKSKGQQRGR